MESNGRTTGIREEFLLMDEGVSGLCLCPDLHDPENENKDLMWLYKRWSTIPDQTHSCNVAITDGLCRYYPDTDALITFERDVAIGVKTADCVPILVYAPDKQGIAAIHAGWKGTLGGIVDNVMDSLEEKGIDPSQMKIVFGPSISKQVYEVSQELADSFKEAGFGAYVSSPNGQKEKTHIDLQGVNMERFLRRGVKPENIKLHDGCSYSSKMNDGTPMYASHRRSGGAPARMLTCIMLLSRSEKDYYNKILSK
ncbi:MAG: polyphenol oxidase family protein [Muribaculaceae bacterium]|nr:polyphenol oxidase family protein [Muribaculaceae bacterium]